MKNRQKEAVEDVEIEVEEDAVVAEEKEGKIL